MYDVIVLTGDASAIIFSSPLPAMLLSHLLLGETIRLYKIGCGLLLYIGVTCVVQPTVFFGDSAEEK